MERRTGARANVNEGEEEGTTQGRVTELGASRVGRCPAFANSIFPSVRARSSYLAAKMALLFFTLRAHRATINLFEILFFFLRCHE